MTTGRLFTTFVICFWLAAMSWLAAKKILPGLMGGDQPDYYSVLDRADGEAPPDCWEISWQQRAIGFAATRVIRHDDGSTVMRSVVQFDELPLESMAGELFGVLAAVIKPLMQGSGDLTLEMLVASQTHFDQQRRFAGFHTVVDLGDMQGFLVLWGQVDEAGKLHVQARVNNGLTGGGAGTPIVHRVIELPQDALVSDWLAPRPELKNLAVGQSWTIPVYRPFPPNSPPQIIEATVVRHDPIFWQSQDTETMLVEYRSDAGASINIASDPVGREWVRRDGTVLRQEVIFSGLRFRFERLLDHGDDLRAELLDDATHPRLWNSTDP